MGSKGAKGQSYPKSKSVSLSQHRELSTILRKLLRSGNAAETKLLLGLEYEDLIGGSEGYVGGNGGESGVGAVVLRATGGGGSTGGGGTGGGGAGESKE